MTRRMALSLVALLGMVAALSANAGPPPLPKGHKVVMPSVRFEGIDKYPDHVFHLYYSALYFGNTTVEVKDAATLKLDFKAKDRVPIPYLLLTAVERKEFEKRKQDDPSLKWLVEAKEGVLTARPTPPETTAPEAVTDVPVTTYRVTIEAGKLVAEKVAPMKSGAASPSGIQPPVAFALAGSFSVAWLGVWFARRRPAPDRR